MLNSLFFLDIFLFFLLFLYNFFFFFLSSFLLYFFTPLYILIYHCHSAKSLRLRGETKHRERAMSCRLPEESELDGDESFKFNRPGSVPFNWEIQPGVPKHINSTSQHRRCPPQQLSPSQSPSLPSSLRCSALPSIKHRHAKLSALLRRRPMSDHHSTCVFPSVSSPRELLRLSIQPCPKQRQNHVSYICHQKLFLL